MATKPSNLLTKKTWTGEDVGRAVIAHLMDEYKALSDPSHRPALQVEDLERLKAGLTKEPDRQVYNRYIRLYDGLLEAIHKAETMQQQFYHGFYRLLGFLERASLAALTLRQISSFPSLVTPAQYKALEDQVRAEASAIMETPLGLFFQAIAYYGGDYGPVAKPPKAIWEGIQRLKKTPFTNEALFAQLIQASGPPLAPPSKRKTKTPSPEKERQALQKEFLKRKQGISPEEIHPTPQPPASPRLPAKGLSKWDLVFGKYGSITQDYFCHATDAPAASFQAFQQEFPEIAIPVLETLRALPPLEYIFQNNQDPAAECISWGELAAHNLLNYPQLITPSSLDLLEALHRDTPAQERTRSLQLAILQENVPAESTHSALIPQLTQFLNFQESQPDQLRTLLIEPALCTLYACEAFIHQAETLYNFPGLTILAPPRAALQCKLDALNRMILTLYAQLKDDPTLEAQIIQSLSLIDGPALEPCPKALSLAKVCLKDLDSFGKGTVPELLYEMVSLTLQGGGKSA